MASETTLGLSSHDTSILSALFDAESKPASHVPVSTSFPPLPRFASETLFHDLRRREQGALAPLLTTSPSSSQIDTALTQLNAIIAEAPDYASAYVNRAQTQRLTFPAEKLFTTEYEDTTSGILEDLRTAIELASPASQHGELGWYQKDVLVSAHTHRGFLLMKAGQAVRKQSSTIVASSSTTARSSPASTSEALEELASKDFMLGARYGNKEAREMSVRTNPYAKMCGVIVKEAMKKEVDEFNAES